MVMFSGAVVRKAHALAALALLALALPARPGEPVGDQVAATWRERAALAERRLAGRQLDACDRAVEEAFRSARGEVTKDGQRQYALAIRIEGRLLLVTYGYKGKRLDTFAVAALPAGWFAYQKADGKTLTVLLSDGPRCALDLCTSGPTADGPCEERR